MAHTRKLSMDVASQTDAPSIRPTPQPRLSTASDAALASLDRGRQERLESVWKSGAANRGARWSPRATLAVSGGVGLLLWGLVALAVSAMR